MAARFLIFFAVALLILGSSHYYVWARLVRDAALPSPWARLATVTLGLLLLSVLSSFVVARTVSRAYAAPVTWVGFSWLGTMFFLVLALGVSDLAKVIAIRGLSTPPTDPERRQAIARLFGGVAALVGLGVSAGGMASALSQVSVRRVRVAIDRLGRLGRGRPGYRIVQISDVHVGPTIGKDFIERIVARINELKPDLVAITGDLVDGSVAELEEHVAPLAKLTARDGVFFVTGNHEYYSGADEWIAHLRKLGVRVLRNEHVTIGGEDGFDLAGIDDASSHGNGHGPDLKKALAGRDGDRACVLLAHQPKGIELADALGVDLQLSGHTHGGQMIPWNFLVRLQQPFVAGLHKLLRAQIYVSRGTGYWGPPMRVGAPAEITEIELVSS